MNLSLIYGIGILFSSSLEMYNYMLFPFVQSIIVTDFYKGASNIGFWIIFLASLFRPLGSLFFGYIGDSYGRKKALILSMLLMGFSCLLIIFLPGYSYIGNYAVVGLIFVRILQVISVSGEHSGVAISLIESFNPEGNVKKAGLASGLVYLFSMFGSFLATFVAYEINAVNWRYAYLFSIILVIFCFILRFLPYNESNSISNSSHENLFKNFIACFLISSAMSALYYFNTVFIPSYFTIHGVLSVKGHTVMYLLFYMFATFFFGWISDYFEKLYLFVLIPSFLLFFSLFFTLHYCNPFVHFINIFLLAMYAGPSHAVFFKLFPKKYRYRSISFSYSLGTSLIGASSPLISSYLIFNIYFIMLYLFLLLSLSIFAIYLCYKDLLNDCKNI